MSEAKLYQKNGTTSSNVELNDQVFGARVNHRLLHLVTTAYGGNLRRGTRKTKERAEVRGGGKKPWRQKGTGRARHGSRRSPIWRGGGTTFGPRVRSHRTNLSDSMKRSALISALSLKHQEDNLLILKDLSVEEPKTKALAQIVKALKLDNARTVCVVESIDEKLKRASSNLKEKFSLRLASDVNAYHLLHRKKVVIDESAISTLEKRALNTAVAEQAEGKE